MSESMMGTINTIWPFLVMGLMFYFLLYRPQKKEQNKRQTMLDSLKVGTRIITIGGVYGEITKLHEDNLRLKIAEGVDIRISKSAVGRLQPTSIMQKEPQAPKAVEAKAAKDTKEAKDVKDAKEVKAAPAANEAQGDKK